MANISPFDHISNVYLIILGVLYHFSNFLEFTNWFHNIVRFKNISFIIKIIVLAKKILKDKNKELSKKALRNTKVLMLDHEILESRLIDKEKLDLYYSARKNKFRLIARGGSRRGSQACEVGTCAIIWNIL